MSKLFERQFNHRDSAAFSAPLWHQTPSCTSPRESEEQRWCCSPLCDELDFESGGSIARSSLMQLSCAGQRPKTSDLSCTCRPRAWPCIPSAGSCGAASSIAGFTCASSSSQPGLSCSHSSLTAPGSMNSLERVSRACLIASYASAQFLSNDP